MGILEDAYRNDLYVTPHALISRTVTDNDIDIVREVAPTMFHLCHTKNGLYNGALAIAHPQIDDKDPLRFFVDKNGELFINPEIVCRRGLPVRRLEGCMSYPRLPEITVARYEDIDVKYLDSNFKTIESTLTRTLARIFQHEIDHFNGKYIY